MALVFVTDDVHTHLATLIGMVAEVGWGWGGGGVLLRADKVWELHQISFTYHSIIITGGWFLLINRQDIPVKRRFLFIILCAMNKY